MASAAALCLGVGSALAGPSHHHKGSTCKYTLTLSVSTASGPVSCSKPAGKGTATVSYSETPNLPDVTITGTYKDKFKKGTLTGSFKVTGSLLPPGPYSGTFKIKKGTKKPKKAHGSGTMKCTQSVLTLTCTAKQTKGSF